MIGRYARNLDVVSHGRDSNIMVRTGERQKIEGDQAVSVWTTPYPVYRRSPAAQTLDPLSCLPLTRPDTNFPACIDATLHSIHQVVAFGSMRARFYSERAAFKNCCVTRTSELQANGESRFLDDKCSLVDYYVDISPNFISGNLLLRTLDRPRERYISDGN